MFDLGAFGRIYQSFKEFNICYDFNSIESKAVLNFVLIAQYNLFIHLLLLAWVIMLSFKPSGSFLSTFNVLIFHHKKFFYIFFFLHTKKCELFLKTLTYHHFLKVFSRLLRYFYSLDCKIKY